MLTPTPAPEGLSLRCNFDLKEVPAKARLAIHVSHMIGPGDGKPIADSLARGGLRTEALINGEVLDYLNHHVERSSAEPRRLTLDVPKKLLRTGKNTVEIRQKAEKKGGQVADCIVSDLALEVPD